MIHSCRAVNQYHEGCTTFRTVRVPDPKSADCTCELSAPTRGRNFKITGTTRRVKPSWKKSCLLTKEKNIWIKLFIAHKLNSPAGDERTLLSICDWIYQCNWDQANNLPQQSYINLSLHCVAKFLLHSNESKLTPHTQTPLWGMLFASFDSCKVVITLWGLISLFKLDELARVKA